LTEIHIPCIASGSSAAGRGLKKGDRTYCMAALTSAKGALLPSWARSSSSGHGGDLWRVLGKALATVRARFSPCVVCACAHRSHHIPIPCVNLSPCGSWTVRPAFTRFRNRSFLLNSAVAAAASRTIDASPRRDEIIHAQRSV
jgi:hypothetical protein